MLWLKRSGSFCCAAAMAAAVWPNLVSGLAGQTRPASPLPVPFAPSTLPGSPAAPPAAEAPMPKSPAPAPPIQPGAVPLKADLFPSGRKKTSSFEIEVICVPGSQKKLSLTTTPIEEWVIALREGGADEVLRHKQKGVPILVAAIQDEKASSWVRLSMKSVRDDREWLIPVFIAGVNCPGPFTARECIEELGHFGPKLHPHLPSLLKTVQEAGAQRGFDDWFRREALKTLDEAEASNEQYIQFVQALLKAKDTSFIKSSDTLLIEALLSAGPASVPAALDLYAPLIAAGRHVSAPVLDPDFWPPLVAQLASESPERRRTAAWLLAQQHPDAQVPAFDQQLITTLASYTDDPDPQLRQHVLQTLVQQPPQDAGSIAALTKQFLDPQNTDGRYTARVLGKCGEAALPAIRQAAHSNTAEIRLRAAGAYRMMKPLIPSEATHLEALARDAVAEVRAFAVFAIAESQHSSPEAVAALEAALNDPVTAEASLNALERLGPAATSAQPLLREKLQGSQPEQQVIILRCLWHIDPHSPFIVPRLKDLLRAEIAALPKVPRENQRNKFGYSFTVQPDDVVSVATRLLGTMGSDAQPAIEELLVLAGSADLSVAQRGLEALQRLGPAAKDAVPRLTEMAKNAAEPERQWAIDALGDILPESEWAKQSKALRSYPAHYMARKIKRRQIAEKTPEQVAKAKVKEFVFSRGGDYSEHAVMESKFNQRALISISMHHDAIFDGELPKLAPLTELGSLHLAFTHVSDAGLKHLGTFSNLRDLSLADTEITGAGLEHLVGLQKLISLELSFNQVGDQGLHHVAKLPALEALYLVDTKVTNDGLKALPALKKLHTLYLSNTAVGDAGMEQVAQCAELKELLLPSTKITDSGLVALRTLTKLEELNLEGTKVTGAGLDGLVSLRELNLAETRATGAGLATLVGLKWLRLANTPTSDAGLQGFRALKNLETLSLEGTLVTDAALEELSHLPKLDWLDLTGTRVTDKGLKQLSQLQTLTQLDLNATTIGDKGLAALDGLADLQSLNVSDTNVTPEGVAAFKKKHPGCFISH